MIKLPRTLHIEGSRMEQGKSDPQAVKFLDLAGKFLVIEEKVDGSGVSIFFDDHLEMQIWHRGNPANSKEFTQLRAWAHVHYDRLFDLLEDKFILFGEWMLHKHTIFYDQLPHYFLESDMYDRNKKIFLSTKARNTLLHDHDYIKQVPVLGALKPTKLYQLLDLISKPFYQSDEWYDALLHQCSIFNVDLNKVLLQTDQSEFMEGLYIKHEDEHQVIGRYKYVRHAFLETILNSGSHLLDRDPVYNVVLGGYSTLL